MVKKNIKGGEVIASGGFGCVFSPALKCKGKKRFKNNITKLMTKKHALEEYNEIVSIRKNLEKIPNYQNYFLINHFNLCEIDKLSENDLKNYVKKCKTLSKDNINANNINSSLDKVFALNMPYGGLPVDDFINSKINYYKLIQLNNTLLNLLNNGIIPMNNIYIYHSDIKDSNILVEYKDNEDLKTRLIDWGLTIEYIPYKNESLPRDWSNRPLQFNVPFSVILFSNYFLDKYSDYLKKGHDLMGTNLKPFVMDYIHFWLNKRGEGHYKYINHIMYMLFSNDLKSVETDEIKTRMIETEFTLYYLSNYIIEILIHFTNINEKTFELRVYLDKVFIHIVDIWGWITAYIPILQVVFENFDKLNEKEQELFQHLKQIFI